MIFALWLKTIKTLYFYCARIVDFHLSRKDVFIYKINELNEIVNVVQGNKLDIKN